MKRMRLDDSFSASPAIVGDELYLRGESYLYFIARPAPDPPSRRTDALPGTGSKAGDC